MMEIKVMTRQHADNVLEMMRVFYASPAVYTNGSEEIFQNDVEACIGDSPYLCGYVFVEGEKIVGYAMTAKSFSTEFGMPCVWIEDLYLIEAFRGQGIGTQFFEFLEKTYTNTLLRLEVEAENTSAVHTYRKNGFDELPYVEMKKIL